MGSSPTRSRRRDVTVRCVSYKIGYPTYDAALDGAERQMERGHVMPGCHITPYQCDECGEWHIYNRIIVPLGRPRQQKAWV